VINNTSLNKWTRLAKKQLDQQFKQRMMEGLNCSLFEATAVVNVVHEIYDTYLEASTEVKPGQMRLTIISAEAPPNKSLDQSQQVTAVLTMYDEQKDLQLKKEGGTVALRRHRIRRLCREAYQQGGLLTVEDLANRLLNCGERTISRDLKALREEGIVPPLRSTVKDMGRGVSHRELVVEHWLEGKEYSEIARETYHSIDAVQNYVSKFKRTVALTSEGFGAKDIAFILSISPDLVRSFQAMHQNLPATAHRQRELQSCVKKNFTQKLRELGTSP